MEPRPQTDGAEGQTDVLGGVGEWGGEVYRGNEGGMWGRQEDGDTSIGDMGQEERDTSIGDMGGQGHIYRGCGGAGI